MQLSTVNGVYSASDKYSSAKNSVKSVPNTIESMDSFSMSPKPSATTPHFSGPLISLGLGLATWGLKNEKKKISQQEQRDLERHHSRSKYHAEQKGYSSGYKAAQAEYRPLRKVKVFDYSYYRHGRRHDVYKTVWR